MTKEEILKYIEKTPWNTNPNVLGGMLDEIAASGNYEQQASGSLEDIWNNKSFYQELRAGIVNNEITIKIDIDASAIGAKVVTTYVHADNDYLYTDGADLWGPTPQAFLIAWDKDGNISTALMLMGTSERNVIEYASVINVNVLIIHHPMS